ncbi:MAG: molybdenum cofactor biosynthesis protein MoaE [Hadesarchaea archaeon]|nr:MAG: molybdenum cofactor biosynthesis protein MoaE [Hadesarchaea archaeon]
MPDVGIYSKGKVTLPDLFRKLRQDIGENVGAIGCFVGVVRGLSGEGERVKFLRYQSSEDAVKKLEQIAADIEKRPNIRRVMIHHIVDQVAPGEDAIYVLVAGHRRDDVFKALPELMNRVKAEVPIWKKEVTERREYWIHEFAGKK